MTKAFLMQCLGNRPAVEPVDAVKLVFQSTLGCGHLLPSAQVCEQAIREELARTAPSDSEPPCTPIGNGLCRLHLRNPLVRELPPERIAAMMRETERRFQGSRDAYLQGLRDLRALVAERSDAFAFTAAALDPLLARAQNAPDWIPSHSEGYRAACQPAYRVVLRPYGTAMPVLAALEQALRQYGRATLVLDGDCAAGKTTLAARLAPLYACNMFHMDDFFLPFAMRTPERLAQPGGNVHYERFAQQVLTGLASGGSVEYDAFDCHSGQTSRVSVPARPVTIIEGSYSLHPAFEAAYEQLHAVRALLTVDGDEQLRRISRRNGEKMLDRFRDVWIPLEKRYLQAYHETRADEWVLPFAHHAEDDPAEEGTAF